MQKMSDSISSVDTKELKKEYQEALKDEYFKLIVSKFKLSNDYLMN